MLRITLLGQFRVEKEGQSVEIASRPAQSLLAFLVLSAGTRQPRAKLAGLLWPDSAESNALSNLRHTLWRLRKAIGSAYILADNQAIAFDPEADYWLDAAILDKKLSENASAEELITSVSTYGGELLPGFYDDWVILERTRLQAVFERRMKRLLDRLVEEGRWDDVLRWAEHWIALGQVPEPAYRALMVAHAALGDLSGVAKVYQRYVMALEEELGVDPSEETKKLYERLSMGERPFVAPTRTKDSVGSTEQVVPDVSPLQLPAFIKEEAGQTGIESSIFVGRERELTRLEGFLRKALAGRGQVVFIVGEAGQGKTSLLNEFARRVQESHANLIVAMGVCNAFTRVGDPYLPFRDVMSILTGDVEAQWKAGVITRDHALRLWHLLPHTVSALLDRGPELIDTIVPGRALANRAAGYNSHNASWLNRLEEVVARKAALSGDQGPEQNRIFEGYTNVLELLAVQQPLMLILDDLQWADVSSIGLLFHLGRRITDSRILIAGTYRPEDVAQSMDSEQRPFKDMMSEFKRLFGDILVDLDREKEMEGRRFVDALLDSEPNRLGERFRRELTRRTRGQVLFTVELLRDWRERGDLVKDEKGRWIADSNLLWDSMPPRVEGVIERRIGRLDPELQELLTVASVEGEYFTAEVVARVRGIDERELVRRLSSELDKQHRLVRAKGFLRLGSQRRSRYLFRHNLFQKFLYDRLDPVARAYQHEAVASELEALYEDELDEIAVQLARHFQEAELADKSIEYLLRAGERAFRLSANQEAISHLSEGLELLKTVPETPERARLELGLQIALGVAFKVTKGRLAPEVGAAFARARELSEQVGSDSQLFMVLWNLWLSAEGRADWHTAREYAEEFTSLAEQADDPALLLQALHAQWTMSLYSAEFSLAYDYTERGMALYNPQQHHTLAFRYGGHDPGVCCLISAAEALWLLGWPDQALKRSQEALNLAEELSHPYSLAFTLTFASQIRLFRREPREALELAGAAVSLAVEQGFPEYLGEATIFRGWALAKLGQVEAGVEEMLQGIDPERGLPHDVERPYFLTLLAEIYWEERQTAEGLKLLTEAMNEIEAGKVHYWDAEIQRLRGELHLTQGLEQAAVQQHYQRAIDVARNQGAKLLELRAVMSLCRLLRRQGKEKEARKLLANIYDWFTEGFETPDLIEAKELMDELS